ncbi:hypothetical protein [Undibacterium sp. RuTC16W]|uniref:hypothetical protein n=1 Tax=Undibacterium sp. RuTC16W TaxID=3413048 RepID=UPI003BF00FB5
MLPSSRRAGESAGMPVFACEADMIRIEFDLLLVETLHTSVLGHQRVGGEGCVAKQTWYEQKRQFVLHH